MAYQPFLVHSHEFIVKSDLRPADIESTHWGRRGWCKRAGYCQTCLQYELYFFSQPDYEDIRSYVQQYLLRNSKSSQSLIESTGRRGYYRLNSEGSADARQLLLQFREELVEEKEEEKPKQDLSLNLFD